MNMMELLAVPGLDGSEKLNKLYRESKRRMKKSLHIWNYPIRKNKETNEKIK